MAGVLITGVVMTCRAQEQPTQATLPPPPPSMIETAKRVGRLEIGLQLQEAKVGRAKAMFDQEVGLYRQIEAELGRLTLELTLMTSDGGTSGSLIKEPAR